jgi:putative ABC transport system substrate-binding protein
MASHIERRKFLATLGGAAAWPLPARAQQPAMPVVGFLYAGSPETSAHLVAAFRKGLGETGYVEGHSVAIEFRFAQGDYKQLPELAADLVGRHVAVIATPSDMPSALAAKAATSRIPIVFGTGGDPVLSGLVPSLNRPGGNITGISVMTTELAAKRLELLKDLIPGATRVGVLANPDSPLTEPVLKDLHTAAASIGLQLEIVTARTGLEIDGGFATLLQRRADAVMNVPDALFTNRRVQIAILAAHHRLPAVYTSREYTEAGGLMSYGPSFPELFREVGTYVGRVLKGERPADLPVLRPTKFELVITLPTARLLGLEIPLTLLARADEVIE